MRNNELENWAAKLQKASIQKMGPIYLPPPECVKAFLAAFRNAVIEDIVFNLSWAGKNVTEPSPNDMSLVEYISAQKSRGPDVEKTEFCIRYYGNAEKETAAKKSIAEREQRFYDAILNGTNPWTE